MRIVSGTRNHSLPVIITADNVGAFDAGAERIECAVGRRMRVGADDQIAAGQMPAFGQHLVADAVADVVEHACRARRQTRASRHGCWPPRHVGGGE